MEGVSQFPNVVKCLFVTVRLIGADVTVSLIGADELGWVNILVPRKYNDAYINIANVGKLLAMTVWVLTVLITHRPVVIRWWERNRSKQENEDNLGLLPSSRCDSDWDWWIIFVNYWTYCYTCTVFIQYVYNKEIRAGTIPSFLRYLLTPELCSILDTCDCAVSVDPIS